MKHLIYLILLSTFLSCDDCRDIDCTTPPDVFVFQLVDTLGVDLFTFSNISPSVVSITNSKTNKKQEIITSSIDSKTIFECSEMGWETGIENANYTLKITNFGDYNFIYQTESKSIDCCLLLGKLEEFSSTDFTYEKEGYWFVIKI